MSLAVRVPRAEGARRWRSHDADRRLTIERHRSKAAAQVKGMDLVLRLEGGRRYEFRGRHYGVPTVPWPIAAEVLEVQERFNAVTSDPKPSRREWVAICNEVARLFKKIAFPEGRLRRLLWPFTPSPLLKASPLEVGMALGFFSVCLEMDKQSSGIPGTTVLPRPSRSRPSSPASSRTTRNGARTASRVRGSTS